MTMAPEKKQSVGICDFCLGTIPRDRWYTSKRTARLHCSLRCKNTANSRAGAPIRSREMKQHVQSGEWENPAKLNPPTPAEQAERARKGRLNEVVDGRWRNPALSESARKKLSRPRKHSGDLHGAIEKLKHGKMEELTKDERRAYRKYRNELRDGQKDEINRKDRERYKLKRAAMTDEEREAQRAKWREQNRRKAQKKRKS